MSSNLSLCKRLQYYILHNKKLDWLKRDEVWEFDKIDKYSFFAIVIMLILISTFGKIFIIPTILLFYIAGVIGHIRHIKTVPGDIESKFFSFLTCFGFLFLNIWFIIILLQFIV